MPKLPPVWALFLFAVLFIAIACVGGQGLAGPAGPQGPLGEQGPQGKIGPAVPDGPAALKGELGTETFPLVLGKRSTSTPLSIKPSVSECEIAPDADVETGHRATQPPTLKVEIPKFQGDYTSRQINRWRREAEDAVWWVPGVWSSWIDGKQNRIVFAVYTIHVAKKAREALADTDVPIGTVIFEVDPKTQLDDPPVPIDSPMGIRISL